MSTHGRWMQAIIDRCELPVATQEMRARLRGTRAYWLLFIAAGLAITVALVFLSRIAEATQATADLVAISQLLADTGRVMFVVLIATVGLLGVFVAPAMTAGAITRERYQQTLEMLLLTRLSNRNIVLGKLCSSLAYILLILLCALPLMALAFIFGGVSPAEMAWAVTVVLSTIILCGAIGIYCTTTFQKTGTAVTLAYSLCVCWVFLQPIFVGIDKFGPFHFPSELYLTIQIMIYATVVALGIAAVKTIISRRAISHWHLVLLWICLTTASELFIFTAPWDLPAMAHGYLSFFIPSLPFTVKTIVLLVLLLGVLVVGIFHHPTARDSRILRWMILAILLLLIPALYAEQLLHHLDRFCWFCAQCRTQLIAIVTTMNPFMLLSLKLLAIVCLFGIPRAVKKNRRANWSLLILLLLLAFCATPSYLLNLLNIDYDRLLIDLPGNPVGSILLQYDWQNISSSLSWGELLLLQCSTPLTIAIQLLLTWAFLTLASGRIGEMRQGKDKMKLKSVANKETA